MSSPLEREDGIDKTETMDKVRIQTKVKRGTGTRDQDTHNIKVRGREPEEAARRLEVTIFELQKRDVFENVRQIQQGDQE